MLTDQDAAGAASAELHPKMIKLAYFGDPVKHRYHMLKILIEFVQGTASPFQVIFGHSSGGQDRRILLPISLHNFGPPFLIEILCQAYHFAPGIFILIAISTDLGKMQTRISSRLFPGRVACFKGSVAPH